MGNEEAPYPATGRHGLAAMHEIDPTTVPEATAPAAASETATPRPAATSDRQPAGTADHDTVEVAALVRNTASRLVVDPSTHITQIEILDPATRTVLRAFPDSDWLKVVRALRAMAAEALVDKRT